MERAKRLELFASLLEELRNQFDYLKREILDSPGDAPGEGDR
jgi:hypothetical protein